MKSQFYPPSPTSVPPNLTQPGPSYKKQTIIAASAVILFVGVYLGLSIWFLWRAIWLLINMFSGGDASLPTFIITGTLGFLGIFMIKAFFFINKKFETKDIEIKPEDEPELFNFIYRIADEAKAPRPHKVYISDNVNASVFYDLSFFNLFFPSKKNLVIGLGLVNVLNLSEFKAILAHEFGHFAQKTMIIGRWVYVAQQIAHAIVAKRDWLDDVLNTISRIDIRIAWIGWVLSIAVWCIRSIAETFFRLVSLTEKALSRQMEFQADLVAVSLTGSDSIVHSLYKLTAADEAYDAAVNFTNKTLRKGQKISDIFAIQSNYLQKISVIRNEARSRSVTDITEVTGPDSKVFKIELAQVPKMWRTHPANSDREKNAKKIYIKSEIDHTNSWVLFKNKEELSKRITLGLYTHLKDDLVELSSREGVELHNREFLRSFLKKEYQGVYMERPTMLGVSDINDLYDWSVIDPNITNRLSELYPVSIADDLEVLKQLTEDKFMLEGVKNKNLDTYEKEIVYQGEKVKRSELDQVIKRVEERMEEVRERVDSHDCLCRQVHFAFAKKLGNGWPEYLISVASIVHNYDHTKKNIEDLSTFFYENLAVISQKRRLGSNDLYPLLNAANELYNAMHGFFKSAETIPFSGSLTEKLGGKQPSDLTTKFTFGGANQENINSWINVLPDWLNITFEHLSILRDAALDELLYVEEFVRDAVLKGETSVRVAPIPVNMSMDYPRYDRNKKRKVAYTLSWFNKFMSADGLAATIGRLGVAGSIIFFAMFFSMTIGGSRVIVYNGLGIDVKVKIGKKEVILSNNEHREISVGNNSHLKVTATDMSGRTIETFETETRGISTTYIYNVAYGAVLYKYNVVYSKFGLTDPTYEILGAPRWSTASVDYYFTEPPAEIQTSSKTSVTKTVIDIVPTHPAESANMFTREDEFVQWVTSHSTWEPAESMYLGDYLFFAVNLPGIADIFSKRLAIDSNDIGTYRYQQEVSTGRGKDSICEIQSRRANRNPNDPNFYYLKVRCMEDGAQQDSLFVQGQRKWPDNPWLAFAAGFVYTQNENWEKANECYNIAYMKAPQLKESIWEEKMRIQQLLGSNSNNTTFFELTYPFYVYVTAVDAAKKESQEDRYYAFKLLQEGKIHEALDFSQGDTITYPMIARLGAVSDGASKELQDMAYFLPDMQGINHATIIPAIALCIKRGESYQLYKDPLNAMTAKGADDFIQFIELVKAKKIGEANALMPKFTAEFKAKAGLLGVILLGDAAPSKWKWYASTLLFLFEKPYSRHLTQPLVM